MKKLLALIMALVMVLSMSSVAFAADGAEADSDTLVGPLEEDYEGTKDDHADIDAYGRLDTDGDGVPDDEDDTPTSNITISVEIAWEAMEWTFTGMHTAWDPNTLSYSEVESTSWSDNVETITVTNASNCDIVAGANFASALSNNFDLAISVNTTAENIKKSESYTDASYEAAIKLTSAADGLTVGYVAGQTGEKTVGIFDVKVADTSAQGIDDDNTKVGTITVTIFKVPAAVEP